ncbi:MAG: alpha/beta hydrolase [Hyphomicrobiales bacterium]|nr:MAG: alpha/beta hydrolase [Hyphomicrobiales bacterium]
MELIASARNPVPSGAVTGEIETQDGVRLRVARWDATATPARGTVCVFQGRTEFIEKYFETIADLRRRGFAVATLDWRGQGLSERLLDNPAKGHVRAFRDYDRDLDAFMRQVVVPNCKPPFFALAHSMGGHILLRHAVSRTPWFERMVVVSPMIEIALARLGGSRSQARFYAEFWCLFGRSKAFTRGGADLPLEFGPFEANELTNDKERYARSAAIIAAHPELGLGAPTIGWLRAALRSSARLTDPEYPLGVSVPLLLFAAGQDTIVSARAIEEFAMRLKVGTHVLIPEARHEILQETDAVRARFWSAFDAYLGIEQAAVV